MAKYVVTRTEDAFPVLYGHTFHADWSKGNARGPFYAPGAESFERYSDTALLAAQFGAEHLRGQGYEVSVSVVER